ncbi:MAG: hypothetical protein WCO10_00805 [bacterium]
MEKQTIPKALKDDPLIKRNFSLISGSRELLGDFYKRHPELTAEKQPAQKEE